MASCPRNTRRILDNRLIKYSKGSPSPLCSLYILFHEGTHEITSNGTITAQKHLVHKVCPRRNTFYISGKLSKCSKLYFPIDRHLRSYPCKPLTFVFPLFPCERPYKNIKKNIIKYFVKYFYYRLHLCKLDAHAARSLRHLRPHFWYFDQKPPKFPVHLEIKYFCDIPMSSCTIKTACALVIVLLFLCQVHLDFHGIYWF